MNDIARAAVSGGERRRPGGISRRPAYVPPVHAHVPSQPFLLRISSKPHKLHHATEKSHGAKRNVVNHHGLSFYKLEKINGVSILIAPIEKFLHTIRVT
jgi:hypothetical protein